MADAEVTERARCVRAIASQTSVSALGVASWQELEVAMDGLPLVSLIVYAPPIAGAPDDAICMSGDAATLIISVGIPRMLETVGRARSR